MQFRQQIGILIVVLALVACTSSNPNSTKFSGLAQFDPSVAAETRVALGMTYLSTGNSEQARFNFERALSFAPESAQANYAMAYYLQQENSPLAANEFFQKAINLAPNDGVIISAYAQFLCQQDDTDQAMLQFDRAIQLTPVQRRASVFEQQARCAAEQAQPRAAIAALDKVLGLEPTNASALLLMAEQYQVLGELARAERWLFEFKRHHEDTVESLSFAATLATEQNQLPDARRLLQTLKQMGASEIEISRLARDIERKQIAFTRSRRRATDKASRTLAKSATSSDAPVRYHSLKKGENLYRISLKYGVTLDRLLLVNKIQDVTKLSVGTRLVIPDAR